MKLYNGIKVVAIPLCNRLQIVTLRRLPIRQAVQSVLQHQKAPFHTAPLCRNAPVPARDAVSSENQELKVTPKYKITFTCKACEHRSSHEMSQQAYKKGTVLIQCPSCKNRHLIADNLKIFSDTNINVEDILREKGESIRKGHVSDGDVEFLPQEPKEVDSVTK